MHGYATSGTIIRLAQRAFRLAIEVPLALPLDVLQGLRPSRRTLTRVDEGVDPRSAARRVALYVHYSANGRVSDMVRLQLDLLAEAGFAIVLITMARDLPDGDWQTIRRRCALVVQRQNFGRDFGAWKDVMPEVRRRWGVPDELMLVNDSVLGPIHPLHPVVATMRSGGDGLFGLTESLQGGPHLQSYMLLGRGRSAVDDLMRFSETAYVSHSKWLLVQFGEIRLARWMRQRGHRVAAVFAYQRLVKAALADAGERQRLAASHHRLRTLNSLAEADRLALLEKWPMNPTHHLWHTLACALDFPFLKTELVARNPGRLTDVADWPAVVPPDSPCPLSMLRAHLATVATA